MNLIYICNLLIKCGYCYIYQIFCVFLQCEEWNVYIYECENDVCDFEVICMFVEVFVEFDEFVW